MTLSRQQQSKAVAYARALHEQSREGGRSFADLTQWRHAVKFSPEVVNILSSMQDENDADLVDKVYEEFKRMVDSDDSTVMVTVTTAVPLDDQLREKVIKQAEGLFNTSIYLVERVDPQILGGIVLEGRNERYDASVRTQLNNIRRTLSTSFMGDD